MDVSALENGSECLNLIVHTTTQPTRPYRSCMKFNLILLFELQTGQLIEVIACRRCK